MTLKLRSVTSCLIPLAVFVHTAFSPVPSPAAEPGAVKEGDLIKILKSDAPSSEKAITCKKLTIYGSKEAVPALAPLLTDAQLTSWARTALEAIPDASAAQALRDAMPKTQGRVLIGIINSLGVRQDREAVSALAAKLNDADNGVASAAAEALGHIGTSSAAQALKAALGNARDGARSSVAYGYLLCAEKALAQGNSSEAVRIYDAIRQTSSLPKQRVLEATRGAILARGQAGVPLLLEQLRSPDIALLGIGLNAARELPGLDVTQALSRELDQANAERQVSILLALSDRTDAAVLPRLLQAAESGPKPVRIAAVGLFDRFRDLSCVPVLLNAAADNDADIARPAKSALARFGSKEVDADLLARLRLASGKTREVLIGLAEQRRISAALPVVLQSTSDSNKEIRHAAIQAVGVLGSEQQATHLVHLLPAASNQDEREDIETALLAICGRNGARALPAVMPLAQQGDSATRVIGLHALAAIGGQDALSAVKSAIKDSDATIQDEAVRTLASWPNTWPDDSEVAEPLLTLAKSASKASHKSQGLQGYLLYIQESKKLSNAEKLEKISELLPNLQTADEKRVAIAALGTVPTAASLDRLIAFTSDSSVAEEAAQGILKITTDRNVRDLSGDVRRKALQTVADKSESETTKKRAQDALRRIR